MNKQMGGLSDTWVDMDGKDGRTELEERLTDRKVDGRRVTPDRQQWTYGRVIHTTAALLQLCPSRLVSHLHSP